MKRLLLIIGLYMASCTLLLAQQQYTVEGNTYTLKTEVDGTATLLWNTIDGEFRYFLKKNGNIIELKNSRTASGYSEEYKDVLREQTADSPGDIDKVKFTLSGLKNYLDAYNLRVDPDYSSGDEDIRLQLRLGPFAGISNAIYTKNPNDAILLIAGADLELVDEVKLRRHSVVLRFRQTFENDEFVYSASQFSLNYRFKFIKTPKLDVYVNGKFVAYTYSTSDFEVVLDSTVMPPITTIETASGGDLSAPATFGLGADFALGKGFLFVTYNDIVGIGVDSNGNFPIDFSVGYKFRL